MPRPAKYNWEEWFTRGRFTLRRGRDYRVSQSSMVQQVRNAAHEAGLHVSIQDAGNRLVVTVAHSSEKV